MTVCLSMIVKDAEHELGPCLDSALPHIDSYLIVDTGSRDRTRDLIKERLGHLPGRVVKRKWRGFRENRTEMINLARRSGADYLLLLDADLTVHHDGPFPPLTGACYGGRVQSRYGYSIPLLIRADLEWEYRGVAHCYLHLDGGYQQHDLPGLQIEDRGHPSPGKIERDLKLLSAEHARDPLDARTVFYLAQTHWDLGNWQQAIHYYRMRAHMGGFAEEAFFARYRLGYLLCEHVNAQEGIAELLEAWRMRPTRAEPLRAIANVAGNVADKMAAPIGDLLFVAENAYGPQGTRQTLDGGKAGYNPAPPLLLPWNWWRDNYDRLTFEEHRAMYDKVAQTGESQARYDAGALVDLLAHASGGFSDPHIRAAGVRGPLSVVEIGGWDGALAAEVLKRRGNIIYWANYEISAAASAASVCSDGRYHAVALDDWYWADRHTADVLVMSHTIEHLTLADVRKTLDATTCRYVFLQAPLNDDPTDWAGYDGGHILEVGWAGLTQELEARGFVLIPSLVKPTVRCYERRAHLEVAA